MVSSLLLLGAPPPASARVQALVGGRLRRQGNRIAQEAWQLFLFLLAFSLSGFWLPSVPLCPCFPYFVLCCPLPWGAEPAPALGCLPVLPQVFLLHVLSQWDQSVCGKGEKSRPPPTVCHLTCGQEGAFAKADTPLCVLLHANGTPAQPRTPIQSLRPEQAAWG